MSELRGEARPASMYGSGGIQAVDLELSMRSAQQYEGRALSRLFAGEERLDATTDTQPVVGTPTGEPEVGQASGRAVSAPDNNVSGDCGDGFIEEEITRVFGAELAGQACRVAACESGRGADGRLDGNWASSGSSFGVFQLWQGHVARWPDFFEGDPPNWSRVEWNVSKAFELYSEQGWRPWSCRNVVY